MEDEDNFKVEFKRYRRPCDQDMKNEVIDFANPDAFHEVVQMDISHNVETGTNDKLLGLIPHCNWQVYRLKSKPGLMFLKNPFLPGHQHQWVTKCLTAYPLFPNVCNLDSHLTRKGMGEVWPLDHQGKSIFKDPKSFKDSSLYKLRWVTLGYHYDWTAKRYSPSNRSPFPRDLACFSEHILCTLGFKQFRAEAAIVNYYHMDSTLSGHTDHSEKDLTAPLISISFGQSAIFLIGGCTKQEKPIPLLLNSGDIIVMADESRLAYHAVPKVLQPPSHQLDGIPSCLSKEVFESVLNKNGSCSSVNVCCLCGKNLEESVAGSCSKFYEKRPLDDSDRGIPLKPKIAATERDGSSLPCPTTTDDTSVDCKGCMWILQNWNDFKFYLTQSRININIRQVGGIADE